jgi:NAD kinase
MKFQNVLIVTKPKQAEVAQTARNLVDWFKTKGLRASTEAEFAADSDLCVVLGGDGTLLVPSWPRHASWGITSSPLSPSITAASDF